MRNCKNKTPSIVDIGEKKLVKEIINNIELNDKLIGGLGHDSSFLDITIAKDEVLVLNTDRSGINLAYTLGLSNAECIGDFGISHAFSDILVGGGIPISASIALLLPEDYNLVFVRKVIKGASKAAKKYGAFISCGDTKKFKKFAMIVTAIGKCKKNEIIQRIGVKKDDFIVITGKLGRMFAGYLAYKNNIAISQQTDKVFRKSLIFQNPPYNLGILVGRAKIANASIDNSDGLSSSIYSLCEANNLGAILYKNKIKVEKEVREIAKKVGVDEFNFCLATGDWGFIYAVPPKNILKFKEIADKVKVEFSIIGHFTDSKNIILQYGAKKELLEKIENDRFGIGLFDILSNNIAYSKAYNE